jgi:peptidoglycan/xylan/chitin deacetylase (PgdA/CDA1 family)
VALLLTTAARQKWALEREGNQAMFHTNQHSVVILMYHSINEVSNERIYPSNIVSPVNFVKQMMYLASCAQVISLDRYVDCVRDGTHLPAGSVILTFDDGYKDSFTNAYPVLRKYGLPATFFLPTAYIGTGEAKWDDLLSYLVRRSTIKEFSVELDIWQGSKRFTILGKRAKLKVIDQLVRSLGRASSVDRQRVLDQMPSQLRVDPGELDTSDLMLSWQDVQKMSKATGISFGAHGVTHSRLSDLSVEAARWEIIGSKDRIEIAIDRPVRFFSYPFGGPDDFNGQIKNILRSEGFECAVTSVYGQNDSGSDLLRLRRVRALNCGAVGFRIALSIMSSTVGEPMRRSYHLFRKRAS